MVVLDGVADQVASKERESSLDGWLWMTSPDQSHLWAYGGDRLASAGDLVPFD
jgi:hypothetical protein